MALILVLLVNLSELAYLPYFQKIDWMLHDGYMYSLGDILYSFINQIGYISLLPSIALYIVSNKKETKGIYLGLVLWNVFEMLQEFDMLLKLNINGLLKIDVQTATVLQIIFINFTVCLMFYGYKKWNTSHPY